MKRRYNVKITTTAERDIAGIWNYIARDSPLSAQRFIDAIEEKIAGLATFPQRNPLIPEGELLQTSLYRHLIYHNYRIIYRIDNYTVYVLRIFHGSKLLEM